MTAQIKILAPASVADDDVLHNLAKAEPLASYAPISIDFIQALSRKLLAPEVKLFPEIVALGFWLRGFINDQKQQKSSVASHLFKPVGIVAHFTPSNVDTMFIYSWICGLAMGNSNIVRVATQSTQAQQRLFTTLNELFELSEYQQISQRNIFVQYDKDSQWSATISQIADARVIWGGDQSVNAIRSLPTKPRARDISFADRYSAAVIRGAGIRAADINKVAQRFWNDSKLFQQQACSSPRILFWCGDTHQLNRFTSAITETAIHDIQPSESLCNEQLVTAQSLVALRGGSYCFEEGLCFVHTQDFKPEDLSFHNGHYVFVIVTVSSLKNIVNFIDAKAQTLTYAGFERIDMLQFATDVSINGIDRIVPIGQAMDFDIIWDGYNLLESLSRHVKVN